MVELVHNADDKATQEILETLLSIVAEIENESFKPTAMALSFRSDDSYRVLGNGSAMELMALTSHANYMANKDFSNG